MTLPCPSCGAEIPFASKSSLFATCAYCRSMVIRKDMDISAIGKMAELPDDISPLQIGTRGMFEGKRFELIGRLKVRWSAGTWNEWYAYFDNGSEGWLAEAQGEYIMSFRREVNLAAAKLRNVSAGANILVGGNAMQATDTRIVTYVGGEGELPFTAIAGETSFNIDLTDVQGRFGTIEIADNEVRAYMGNYVGFDDLHLSNLRPLEGW